MAGNIENDTSEFLTLKDAEDFCKDMLTRYKNKVKLYLNQVEYVAY